MMDHIERTIALILLRLSGTCESVGMGQIYEGFPSLERWTKRLTERDLEQWAAAEELLEALREGKGQPADGSAEALDGEALVAMQSHLRTQNHSGIKASRGPGAQAAREGGEDAAPGVTDPSMTEQLQVLRYGYLLALMGWSVVARSFLDLQLAQFVEPSLSACLVHHFGYGSCLHLAFLLEGREFPGEEEIMAEAEAISAICYIDRSRSPIQYAEHQIDERVMGFLSGSDEADPLLAGFTQRFAHGAPLQEAYIFQDKIREAVDFFQGGGQVLQIAGRGGRRFLARHVARGLGMDFLFLRLQDLLQEPGETFAKRKRALIREALFSGAGICFYGLTDFFLYGEEREGRRSPQDMERLERMLWQEIRQAGILLILCADTARPLSLGNWEECRVVELPQRLSYTDRRCLWEGFAHFYGLEADPADLAMRYHLNASEAARALLGLLERRQDGDADVTLSRLAIQSVEGEDNLGRIIYPATRLEDVKLSPALRGVLRDVITSVRTSHSLLEEWGLRERYPYGRAVSLLLAGPPGTGKTMTANAIAAELGLPLYQVNLANIVDKYIGETEKKLERAFSFAEKTNAVLFFDEADALFGKRSEVKDAHDKYANTEISYLLQRIEAFDGIFLMATNIKGNIDPAFLRRIRFVVRFENPDEETRRAIWESLFTKDLPHEEIDLDYLAKQFDQFTGSVIKTVFLNACSLAMGEGSVLCMRHLLRALKTEIEKTTSVTFASETLGKYSYLA